MRASKTAVIMWKFQSHFATNWKQIRIPPRGNVVKLEAGANEERGEGVAKSWQIYNAQGYKRVPGGKEGAPPAARPRHTHPPAGARERPRPRARALPSAAAQNNKAAFRARQRSDPIENLQPDKLEHAEVRGREGFFLLKVGGWGGGGREIKQLLAFDFSVWHLLRHHGKAGEGFGQGM